MTGPLTCSTRARDCFPAAWKGNLILYEILTFRRELVSSSQQTKLARPSGRSGAAGLALARTSMADTISPHPGETQVCCAN